MEDTDLGFNATQKHSDGQSIICVLSHPSARERRLALEPQTLSSSSFKPICLWRHTQFFLIGKHNSTMIDKSDQEFTANWKQAGQTVANYGKRVCKFQSNAENARPTRTPPVHG